MFQYRVCRFFYRNYEVVSPPSLWLSYFLYGLAKPSITQNHHCCLRVKLQQSFQSSFFAFSIEIVISASSHSTHLHFLNYTLYSPFIPKAWGCAFFANQFKPGEYQVSTFLIAIFVQSRTQFFDTCRLEAYILKTF